ncbi:acetyltransferase [Vibrio cholerae]|nr:acetyltransferase [Vibrio cholerae]
MVTVVVIEFSGMRCQPLRRALCNKFDSRENSKGECIDKLNKKVVEWHLA